MLSYLRIATMSALSGTLIIMAAAAGCGSTGEDGSSSDTETQQAARRRGTGGSSGGGGTVNCSNINAIIAAAQTPDGAAIPQPPGPNGQCPPVLVCLGFWSCPTQGQTCTYTSGSTTHHCSCVRTDGEGQLPSWVCDQP